MSTFKITNGQITYKVKQVGEYMFTVSNGSKSIKRVDPLNKEKYTKYWSEESIIGLMNGLNMWIKEE